MSVESRLSWDEYALELSRVAALRSEDPFQKVGACALDFSNRVIGVAYNGLAPGKEVDGVFWSDRDARRPFVIHAETNLLALIKRGECKTIACTLLPCTSCAVSIAAHGVQRVVFQDIYHRDTTAFKIFNFYGIEYRQITSTRADTSSGALLLESHPWY